MTDIFSEEEKELNARLRSVLDKINSNLTAVAQFKMDWFGLTAYNCDTVQDHVLGSIELPAGTYKVEGTLVLNDADELQPGVNGQLRFAFSNGDGDGAIPGIYTIAHDEGTLVSNVGQPTVDRGNGYGGMSFAYERIVHLFGAIKIGLAEGEESGTFSVNLNAPSGDWYFGKNNRPTFLHLTKVD